jgi:hypothetical protein
MFTTSFTVDASRSLEKNGTNGPHTDAVNTSQVCDLALQYIFILLKFVHLWKEPSICQNSSLL